MYYIEKQTAEAMKVKGTEAWEEVWELIYSKSGDIRGADATFIGFFINEAEAEMVQSALNKCRCLSRGNCSICGKKI